MATCQRAWRQPGGKALHSTTQRAQLTVIVPGTAAARPKNLSGAANVFGRVLADGANSQDGSVADRQVVTTAACDAQALA